MEFEFKDKAYAFPACLADITLGKRVAFHEQHGRMLDERLAAIAKLPDGLDKEMQASVWHLDNAMSTFAFYADIPLVDIQASMPVDDITAIYNTDIALLQEQERTLELLTSYQWNNETWIISAPELKPGSKMTLIEFITGKEIIRQFNAIGKGKWDALPYLCAVYLRKEGEHFTEDMVAENSQRLKLFNDLPLDIALSVAFFLSGTLSIYKNTLAFSSEGKPRVSAQPATSNSGDG